MSAPPPGAAWLPREGPVSVVCDHCYRPGSMVLEHRRVWGDAQGLPQDPHPVAQGCPQCGGGELRHGTAMVPRTPPGSVAGMAVKATMYEVRWVSCLGCGHGAPVQLWPWLRCTTPECGRESRGTYRVS